MDKQNKVVLIGTGFVGMSFAYSSLNQGVMDQLVLVDINKEKAIGEAMDLNHGLPFAPTKIDIYAGDYSDCKDADIVVIAAGVSEIPEGGSRIDLLNKNALIMKSIVNNIMEQDFNGIILVASNPVDILTYVTWKESGLDKNKVIGSGTVLDSARLRFELSKYLDVDSRNIHANILGEHGDSEFVPWSNVYIGTKSLLDVIGNVDNIDFKHLNKIYEDVRDSAYDIIDRKGATYYGIGMSLARIVRAILDNENAIFCVSAMVNNSIYDIKDVYFGIPCVLNQGGIREIMAPVLLDNELKKLQKSADILKDTLKKIGY